MSNIFDRIPVASVDLSGNEEKYAVEAIKSTWISSTGKFLSQFENEFANLCQTKHAVAVCNGTVALHLALLGLDVRPGDEVLVPSLTYIATANAVRYVGAEPVFVDVDPETWCMDPKKIEAAITRRTKGIIPVHLLGHPADMDEINKIAAVHGLWVVEDAAEALDAKYKGKPVGGFSKMATFSFFGNKLLTCGEGGAVTLNDDSLATRIKTLRGQGMDPTRRYYFPITGYNFRLTNLAAAILCGQMERKKEIIEKRKMIFARYDNSFKNIKGIKLQPCAKWAELSPWMYACLIDEEEFGCSRNAVMEHLNNFNIETRPMFISLHKLPPFREESLQRCESLPETEYLSESGIMLPTYNMLSEKDQNRVIETLLDLKKQVLHRKKTA